MKTALIFSLLAISAQEPTTDVTLPPNFSSFVSNLPRGSRIITFQNYESGESGRDALATVGLDCNNEEINEPAISQVAVENQKKIMVLRNSSRFSVSSDSVPLFCRVEPPCKELGLILGNGYEPWDDLKAFPAKAELSALDANGNLISSASTIVGQKPYSLLHLKTNSDNISSIRLTYGRSTREEEISAIGIYRSEYGSVPTPIFRNIGQKNKLIATWLEARRHDEAHMVIRIIASLKPTDARNSSRSPFEYQFRSILRIIDPSTGAIVREMAEAQDVLHVASVGNGAALRNYQDIVAFEWDGKDEYGNVLTIPIFEIDVVVSAVRLNSRGDGDVHKIDEVALVRYFANSFVTGSYIADGSLAGKALMRTIFTDVDENILQEITNFVNRNPESASSFLEIVFDTQASYRDRIKAIWFLTLLHDRNIIVLISPITQDADPSVAAAAENAIRRSANW